MWLENLLVQLLGLAGFGLLAVPAFHAAKYSQLLVALQKNSPAEADFGREAHKTALEALHNHRDSWTAWKGHCLRWGTVLTILSYGLAAYLAYNASATHAHAHADEMGNVVSPAPPPRS